MTIVYGNQVEPGGMTLDDTSDRIECPNCGKETAVSRYWEACEGGSINQYHSIYCSECGYSEGDGCDDDVDYGDYAYSACLESREVSFYDMPFGDALSNAIDARCELALARILASANEAASAEHLEAAYSIALDEGRYAYRNGRKISPLMATEPFLLKYWEEGVSNAKCDEAIYRAGLG